MRRLPPALSSPRPLTVILCLLIVSTLSLAEAPDRILGEIDSSQRVELPRSLHPKAQPQYDRGPVDPEMKFSYVTLQTSPSPSQQIALDKLMADQQNPSSPNYHNWLSPAQYADQFGLSQNDINKITAWLKAQGFTVISVGGGRNTIVFSGTASQIETAFETQIHHFDIGSEKHFANATALKIPAAWSGIVIGVRGLNSFHMKPMGIKKQPHKDYYFSDSNYSAQFLAPGDIAAIYDINALYSTSINGAGQKLAIIGQTDVYLNDINYFRSGFGLSQIPTTGSGSCTTNSSNIVVAPCTTTNFAYKLVGTDPGTAYSCGDLAEADLDIEWSGATARGAQIIFVNSPIAYDSNCDYVSGGGVEEALSAAINPPSGPPVAKVISMSYGACEANANVSDETELQQGNVEGVTIVNSSGDMGAAACDGFTSSENNLALNGLAVNYPASSQYVTGVGGSAVPFLDLPPASTTYFGTTNTSFGGSARGYVPEQVWNDVDEYTAYCLANPTNTFCSGNGITSGPAAQAFLGIGAGGGGASNCFGETAQGVCTGGFPQPVWQQGLSVPEAPAGVRYVPDVSLQASPNFPGYIICTQFSELGLTGTGSACTPGGTTGIVNTLSLLDSNGDPQPSIFGGTSVSTPIFAGIVTLLNQHLGGTGLGNINQNLYYLAAYDQSAFHPINTGDNNVYCAVGTPSIQPAALQCPAAGVFGYLASNADTAIGTGYNLATGLGSVDAYNLVTTWNESKAPAFTLAVPAPVSTVVNQPVVWNSGTLIGQNSYNNTVSLTCVPSSTTTCSISPSTVQLTPNPTTGTSTGTFQPSTGGAISTAGVYSFDVTGTDGTLVRTHTVSLMVNTDVSVPPSLTFPPAANAGQSASTSLSVTPVGGSTFTAAVTYACSGLPAGASCSFSPTLVAAGSPANPNVTVTVQTAGPFTGTATGSARPRLRSEKQNPWLPLSLPLAGILLVGAGKRLPRRYKVIGLCLTLAVAGFLVACGGGGSSPIIPIAPSVSVSPAVVSTLYPNLAGAPAQTAQFTATVSPSSTSQSVTWAANNVPGGNATVGTISVGGLYTAPATLPSSPAVTITATSSAAATPGMARVNLLTPTPSGTYPITVTVTTSSAVHATSFNLTVN